MLGVVKQLASLIGTLSRQLGPRRVEIRLEAFLGSLRCPYALHD
jgi:hypothetical protein